MSELKKSLRIARISNDHAARMLEKRHPLGAGHVFSFALGIYWQERCEGVMTFGNPISNLAVARYEIEQRECLELRKMILSDIPPTMSESRALSVAARIVSKRYPNLKLLLTYCDESEKASAYVGAGWIPQQSHTYVREMRIGDRWYTTRNANRLGIAKQATEKKTVSRRKYILPLTSKMRASVAQLAERVVSNDEVADRNRPGRFKDTSNSPSRPLTGSGDSSGLGSDNTQAKSEGIKSQQAAAASSN